MSERWGSHWRWRLPLLIVLGVLLGYGWILADQWKWRFVVPGSTSPAILSNPRRGDVAIEAFDWKLNKRWHVANTGRNDGGLVNTLRPVGDGKAVAWHEGTTVHVVDLAPPHEHRQYQTLAKYPDDWFVGMTDDERFAVFQSHGERVPTADGGTEVLLQRTLGKKYPAVLVQRTIDLKSRKVVEMRAWDSSVALNGPSNQFLSRRQGAKPTVPDEPAAAVWKISSEGKWEKVEERNSRFTLATMLSVAGDKEGRWRLLKDKEVAGIDEEMLQSRILSVSPSGDWAWLFDAVSQRMFLVNARSEEVKPLAASRWSAGVGEFVDGERAILMADLRDDIRLVDIQTGKVLARDEAGSQRRNRLVVVAVLLVVASAILLGTAIRESHHFWALADVAASFVAAQMAVGYVLISIVRPELPSLWLGSQFLVLPIVFYLLGMFVGAATMVGVYWSFGRGWLLWRWLAGGLGLLLFAFPLAKSWDQAQNENNFIAVLGVIAAFGLFFAGANSCFGLLIRALGWTIRDRPVEESMRQFRLATFFLVVAAIAVLIVVGQWLFAGPNVVKAVFYAFAGIAIVASGMILVAILLSGVKARLVTAATALFALLVAIGIYLHGEYPMGPTSRYEVYLVDGPVALATIVTIALPCLILRLRGWRWRRGTAAAKISEGVPQVA